MSTFPRGIHITSSAFHHVKPKVSKILLLAYPLTKQHLTPVFNIFWFTQASSKNIYMYVLGYKANLLPRILWCAKLTYIASFWFRQLQERSGDYQRKKIVFSFFIKYKNKNGKFQSLGKICFWLFLYVFVFGW